MDTNELYWLAGLLEGEGSFLNAPPSAPNKPRISIQMTDLEVIQKVARLLQVNYIAADRRKPDIWKTGYRVIANRQH